MNVHSASTAPTGIVVGGRGEAAAPPDVAVLHVGASVARPAASEAVRDLAARSQSIVAALTAIGIGRDDVQTAQFDVNPERGRDADAERVVAYRASQLFRVRIAQPQRAGEAVDAAARAAGDAFVTQGITFDLENRTAVLDRARSAAWKEAREKAAQLARLSGVRLGAPEYLEESVGGREVRPLFAASAASAPQPMAMRVEPGQVRIEVNLTVRYAIAPPSGGAVSAEPSAGAPPAGSTRK